jgi:hypothetical protein
MKAYVITTGTVFALITLAHVARVFAEGAYLLREPAFIVTSAIAVALCVWAFRVLARLASLQKVP